MPFRKNNFDSQVTGKITKNVLKYKKTITIVKTYVQSNDDKILVFEKNITVFNSIVCFFSAIILQVMCEILFRIEFK